MSKIDNSSLHNKSDQAPESSARAYDSALRFANEHYENFPVASFLIRRDLRKHVAIIYWFARTADDLADEGNEDPEIRIENLNRFENRLTALLTGSYTDNFDKALHQTIIKKNLTPQLLYDLLSAFKQDVVKKTYADFNEILDYCRRSANPIGRLILQLYDIRKYDAYKLSDKVCTGLQLANFYQDISIDTARGRYYFPEDEMIEFKVDRFIFEKNENNANLRAFLARNVDRADQLLKEGSGILPYLSGRLKIEIKWTIAGGREILSKIRKNNFDITRRPSLNKIDFTKLLIKSALQ